MCAAFAAASAARATAPRCVETMSVDGLRFENRARARTNAAGQQSRSKRTRAISSLASAENIGLRSAVLRDTPRRDTTIVRLFERVDEDVDGKRCGSGERGFATPRTASRVLFDERDDRVRERTGVAAGKDA